MARFDTERIQARLIRYVDPMALAIFLVLTYRKAWLSDDAFISLRTVTNVLNGYGLRWNVDERVQAFTHPLWLFFLVVAHACTNEPFYSTLILSWLVSGAAVGLLLFATPGSTVNKLTAVTVLMLSNAFVDFSSSGLENPLTHLLIIAFIATVTRPEPARWQLGFAFWIAGCAALNRLDSVLLFAPMLALLAFRTRHDRFLARALPAVIPLAAWEIFSILYYGFPFPNTAYAKLAQAQIGTPIIDGLNYLYSSLLADPVTLTSIAVCFGVAVASRDPIRRCLVAGSAVYLVYVVRIGGDFMCGRFLAAPLCMCAATLATTPWLTRRLALLLLAGLLAVGMFGPGVSPWRADGATQKAIEQYIDRFGIHDERRLFFAINSLVYAKRMNPGMLDHPWSRAGFEMRQTAERAGQPVVRVVDAIGHSGYFAGPRVHLVDAWALADALVARLPPVYGKFGHFPRVIPRGYVDTLATGKEMLFDPNLAEYYRHLSLIIRGRLWDPERLKTIWHFNTGVYQSLLDRYAYVRGREVSVQLRLMNPATYKCVSTYVWNDYRVAAYALDCASEAQKQYDIDWRITAHGATLLSPIGAARTSTFEGLRKSGVFTVAVAFSDGPGAPMRELHELRFPYDRTDSGLNVQRHPWPAWIENFPVGPWHDGHGRGVLALESVKAE